MYLDIHSKDAVIFYRGNTSLQTEVDREENFDDNVTVNTETRLSSEPKEYFRYPIKAGRPRRNLL